MAKNPFQKLVANLPRIRELSDVELDTVSGGDDLGWPTNYGNMTCYDAGPTAGPNGPVADAGWTTCIPNQSAGSDGSDGADMSDGSDMSDGFDMSQ